MSATTAAPTGRAWTSGWILVLTAVCLVSALEAASLYRFYLAQTRLPLWDMAGHGWGGVELLRALEQGRPLHFLDLLNRQDKWPFGYSLLLLPFLALADASFASATLLSTVLFALAPLLLLWAAREVDRGPAGLWGGWIGAALFLASPLERLFAILIMRETAGVFFSLLALCFYLRARRLGTPWAWRLAGLSSLTLILIKYNYALVWGLALLLHEVWRMPPDRRRELGRRTVHLLRPWGRSHGAHWSRIVLALYLVLLIAAAIAGINPGIGIYAGLVMGAGVFAVRRVRDREGVRDRWRRWPVEVRAALATVVLPLWIWCLSPQPIHPKNIFAFLRNRAAGPPLLSAESLGFYPRSLARDYAPATILGVLILLLLAVSLIRLRKAGEPFRLLVLMAALGLGLATFHPYKEIRFLAVSAPFLMLAAALAFSRAVHGGGSSPLPRKVFGGLLCAAAIAGVGTVAARADLDGRLEEDYTLYSARPGLWRPLAFLADNAGGPTVAVIGTFNELSDNLVRWRLALDEASRETTVVDPPARFDTGLPAPEVQARLQRWIDRERPERVLAIRLLPASRFYQSQDFQTYNAWQLAAIRVLKQDLGWRIRRRQRFGALRIEVEVLERANSASSPTRPHPNPSPEGEGL